MPRKSLLNISKLKLTSSLFNGLVLDLHFLVRITNPPKFNRMFVFSGIKVVFRCSLVILKKALSKDILEELSGMYETLNHLKHFDLKDSEPDVLMNQVT